jgi:8-oxo-dGTP diphosphatase
MDVVRSLFRALNAGDTAAAARLYHADSRTEHVFSGEREFCQGREAIEQAWSEELAGRRGALAGGHRFEVTRIAGIETGWGWVRAEWVSVTADDQGQLAAFSGYSYFWIEEGLIRRHRTTAREVPVDLIRQPRAESERRYPSRPLVGVGAVIFGSDGAVVLVKRRHEPLAGQWSLPGGMLELGETLEAGVEREMFEETGLHVDVGPVVEVFDRILLDDEGRVRYHFVLVDYVCTVRGGSLTAGSDVSDVIWADPAALAPYRLAAKARDVVDKATVLVSHIQSPR